MKWEYKVFKPTRAGELLQHELNGLGKNGWELVTICDTKEGILYYLKRAVEQ